MKNRLWLVSVTGGLLSAVAWHEKATGLIMMCAFVPYLYIFQYSINEKVSGRLVFLRMLPGFIIYNLLTLLWLRNASVAGLVYAVTANAFLMSSVFWLSYIIYRRSSSFLGYTSLLSFWLILEHINSRLSMLTPWLNLGNVLGNEIMFIQWYDITGISGGTLWILLCNMIIFFIMVRANKRRQHMYRLITLLILLFILPSGLSFYKYYNYSHDGPESEILIIQPNIDPYTEKFSGQSFERQLRDMLHLAGNNMSGSVDWLILPETAVDDPFYEDKVLFNKYYLMIDSLAGDNKNLSIITGVTTMRSFHASDKERPVTAAMIDSSNVYYEIYNTAMQVNPGQDVNFYHKSKLVPGIEKKINILPPFILDRLVPDLGGTMTGYGSQDERTVFIHPDGLSRAAPLICYESVYGDFVTGYVRNGANFITIITNDGWWKNTAGYKQHLMFARIRAIENRRAVARTANTGISCFIDSRGNIIKQTGWWEKGVLSDSLRLNNDLTFYSSYGDVISRYISVFGIFILIITFIAVPIRRLRYK
ncbi:MAG: apolipoprotein N-acyltransferase [Bacteroidales bacterium]|nr:apolipoprotein N-acyltransferase [Bacteroidales bacterium]